MEGASNNIVSSVDLTDTESDVSVDDSTAIELEQFMGTLQLSNNQFNNVNKLYNFNNASQRTDGDGGNNSTFYDCDDVEQGDSGVHNYLLASQNSTGLGGSDLMNKTSGAVANNSFGSLLSSSASLEPLSKEELDAILIPQSNSTKTTSTNNQQQQQQQPNNNCHKEQQHKQLPLPASGISNLNSLESNQHTITKLAAAAASQLQQLLGASNNNNNNNSIDILGDSSSSSSNMSWLGSSVPVAPTTTITITTGGVPTLANFNMSNPLQPQQIKRVNASSSNNLNNGSSALLLSSSSNFKNSSMLNAGTFGNDSELFLRELGDDGANFSGLLAASAFQPNKEQDLANAVATIITDLNTSIHQQQQEENRMFESMQNETRLILTEFENVKARLNKLQTAMEERRNRSISITTDISMLSTSFLRERSARSQAESQIHRLNDEVKVISKQAQESKAAYENKISELENRLLQERSERKPLLKERDDLRSKVDALERRIEHCEAIWQKERKDRDDENAELRRQVQRYKSECVETEARAQELALALQTASAELAEHSEMLRKAEEHALQQQQQYESEIAALRKALEEQKSRAAIDIEKQRAMGKIILACNTQLQQLKFQFTELKKDLSLVAPTQSPQKQKGGKHQHAVIPLIREKVNNGMTELQSAVSHAMQKMLVENKRLLHLYARETRERKRLFNQLQEIRGNIRVFCRVRPILEKERYQNHPSYYPGGSHINANEVDYITFPADNVVCVRDSAWLQQGEAYGHNSSKKIKRDKQHLFEFDRVFDGSTTQEQIFEEVEPLAISVLDGFHATVFAYGQTGSGKTFTMEGPPHNRGLNYRILQALFHEQQQRSQFGPHQYVITVSILEIYNEQIFDLLLTYGHGQGGNGSNLFLKSKEKKLDIRQGPAGVFVPDVTEVEVTGPEDIMALLARAGENRATKATGMNERSSRSHCVVRVSVNGINTITQEEIHGRLHLIDLAGSERVNELSDVRETQHINKSLSALGDVIEALAANNNHIPYRNSKLTYLLQDSLGCGNKTLMIVTVSPTYDSMQETLCSLYFAQRVSKVQLGQATKHIIGKSKAALPQTPRSATSSSSSNGGNFIHTNSNDTSPLSSSHHDYILATEPLSDRKKPSTSVSSVSSNGSGSNGISTPLSSMRRPSSLTTTTTTTISSRSSTTPLVKQNLSSSAASTLLTPSASSASTSSSSTPFTPSTSSAFTSLIPTPRNNGKSTSSLGKTSSK